MARSAKQAADAMEFARLDFGRGGRTGFGEAVYGPGKTPEQMAEIFAAFRRRRVRAMATRVSPEQADAVAATGIPVEFDRVSRTLASLWGKRPAVRGKVAVLTGGTADIPVAEECARTLEFNGAEAIRFYDVGVAGLHRLLGVIGEVRKADAVVAVAGMEGALPSVVAGLVRAPVIAVPASTGYGFGAKGVAAALAMLNSCAEGVSVVNIDNGFGAALVALRMLARAAAI